MQPPKFDLARSLAVLSLALSITAVVIGCAALQPGADPLVVRTEQLETTGTAAFDLVVNTDDANRDFWLTNAPAFHTFAEYLRTPTPILNSTNILPKGLAIIWNVDQLKVAYKANASASNALISAVGTLGTLVDQAGSWSNIVTNNAALH